MYSVLLQNCLFVLIFWSGLRRCVLVPGTLAFHFFYPFLCDYFRLDHMISVSLEYGTRTGTVCTDVARVETTV